MRRSTRLTTKRAPPPPDSSEEDEEEQIVAKPKIIKKAKLSHKKQEEDSYNSSSDSDTDEPAKTRRKPKTNGKAKLSSKETKGYSTACLTKSEINESKEEKENLKTNKKEPNEKENFSSESSTDEPKKAKQENKTIEKGKKLDQNENTDSSSESDIENYLKPADQIDLNSSFFQIDKSEEKKSFEAIESNIFAGINRLSESESESESEKVKTIPETENKNPKPIPTKINFQQLHDYTKKLEEAKQLIEKYEAKKVAKQIKQKRSGDKKSGNENLDISGLLALGEAKADSSTELLGSIHSSDFESCSDSGKEDWEEVEEHELKETKESIVPKDGVQITVQLPDVMRKKKGIDLVACMKRRLNRIRKENQVLVHKVHLLCWLGHGNYVNQVLNNQELLAMALSLLPSQHCYPSERTDLKYLEQIVKWYGNTVENVEKSISKNMTLEKLLKLQINRKQAYNKKMLVYIFICILRSLGIQCRLVISFEVAPLRPPASELHSLSTKTDDKKKDKQKDENMASTSKISPEKLPEVKINNENKIKTKTNKSQKSEKKPNLKNLNSKEKQNETNEEVKIKKVKEETRKPNTKPEPTKVNSKTTNKSKAESNTIQTAKSKSKNKSNSDSKQATGDVKTKKSDSTKTSKEEFQQKAQEVKSKSRSKNTKEETSTSKTKKSDLLNTKRSTRSNTPQDTPTLLQVDGANDDSDDEPTTSQKPRKPNLKKLSQEDKEPCPVKKHPKRLRSLPNYSEITSEDDFIPQSPKKTVNNNTYSDSKSDSSTNLKTLQQKSRTHVDQSPTKKENPKNIPGDSKSNSSTNLKKLQERSRTRMEQIPTKKENRKNIRDDSKSNSSTNLKKLKQKSTTNTDARPKSLDRSQYFGSNSSPKKQGDVRDDIISIMKGRMAQERTKEHSKLVKPKSGKSRNSRDCDYDSDYAPEPVKKKHHDSDDEFYQKTKVKVKQRVKVKKDDVDEGPKKKKGVDVWVEVFLEAEEKWITADVVKGQVHCVSEIHSRASHPISYIVAWSNDNSIKDITQRYCPNWNTVTRKLRIDTKWWKDSLKSFEGRKTARDREEDEELARLQLEKPLPTTISEYKNHPLYVLKRHLLKFQALYPLEPITLGFIRKEAVYPRECVHTLHSREVWIKHAKVVKPGEQPYKIVKAMPKYDRLSGQVITDRPLEIFGKWQVEEYVPPIAENGIVPRNAYGNVELYKASMLPKGTVHLQLPGLNKLARKMNIDCAPAMVGFDFHAGGNHPVFDGVVVCEEHSESLIAAWYLEQEEQEKKELEKTEKRVYGNWKKLIKGLLIRERLKARYNFGEPSQAGTAGNKRKSKGPKFVSKKRRLCSGSESDTGDD